MTKLKKYHYIYRTTNNITGRYYIGLHTTTNLEDGYLGSGKRLRYSINKYGKENHTLEILEFLNSREELKRRENEIVTLDEIAKKECMNLVVGGCGWPSNGKQIGGDKWKHANEYWKYPNNKKRLSKLVSNRNKDIWSKLSKEQLKKRMLKLNWTDKTHSDETKLKMSNSKKGKGIGCENSQYGTCWITNEKENKKIYRGDKIPKGFRLGRKIKKL